MSRRRLLKRVAAVLLILALGSASFFLGSKYALEHLTTARVTPDELGQAMKTDHFFRTYRENTLLVTGKVLSIESRGDSFEVIFAGTNGYQVRCSVKGNVKKPVLGSQATFVTEAAGAARLPNGVLLKNCVLL